MTKRMSGERLAALRTYYGDDIEARALLIEAARHIDALTSDLEAARGALEQSVKFQSHYAAILNDWDGGKRMVFANADAWMDRLRALKDQKP